MSTFILLLKVLCLASEVTGWGWGGNSFGLRSCKCEWQFGGQCKTSCDYGEYVLGPGPCEDGRYGVCCAEDLPCSSYGGECKYNGCHPYFQTAYTYKVRCPSVDQTCCLRTTMFENNAKTTTRQCPAVTARILGGFPVNSVCQWPWMVSLRLGTVDNAGPTICAGILLSETKVLTTASCAQGNFLVATFNESDVTQYGEVGEINIGVSHNASLHPNFVPSYAGVNDADLAILTLERRVPFTDCTSAACLPLASESLARDSRCWIAGWGLNEAFDGQLHEANVNTFTNEECRQIISYITNRNSTPEDKLCSLPLFDLADACIGDNGGMLVCENSSGEMKLFGIISDNACSGSLPILYTDIKYHLSWITNNI